ncbi:WxL domain-containing protein [Lysinibacillus sp. NPDC093688]|uniref:WxL domain-containing protein n=1 Tax=Lysinibacillus sp. NPDC093688 TaxID=3390577 RepID=UPI003CFE9A89
MKINFKTLGIAATMVTGFVLAGGVTPSFAEEEGGGSKKEANYDTKAILTFKPGDGKDDITKPVDPTDPGKIDPVEPVDPTEPDGKPKPGTPGPLSIDYASGLDFGEQKITSTNQVYKAKAQKFGKREKPEGPNYVQVTDNRGTETGWSLQVKQNGQFKSESGKELEGAEITFKNAWVNTASASKKPSIFKESFTLKTDGTGVAENIMSAKAGEGAGTYVLAFGDDATGGESIELSVPGKTTKYAEKYSTSLTWTLTDTPGQGGVTEPE